MSDFITEIRLAAAARLEWLARKIAPRFPPCLCKMCRAERKAQRGLKTIDEIKNADGRSLWG